MMRIMKLAGKSFNYLFLLTALCAIMLASCEEEGPIIDLRPKNSFLLDTTYVESGTTVTPQQRNALIEDFTGVKCPNCPTAQAKASAIEAANPGRVVIVAIHPTTPSFEPLTKPFSNSTRDMRNHYGTEMMTSSVGTPANLPSGAVDRKIYAQSRTIAYNTWETRVNADLLETTPANLEITNTFDSTTRELLVEVITQYTSTATDTGFHHLTVLLTESGIISPQDFPTYHENFYEHNHVLDSVITPIGGVQLNADKQKGRVYIKQFKITLPALFVAANCEIVAILHKDATRIDVVHVIKKHLY